MKWLARLGLLIGGLLLAVVLAELIARVHAGRGEEWLLVQSVRWYDTSVFQTDQELGQVLRPGAEVTVSTPEFSTDVSINSLGLRGPELGEKTKPRLLTVGDSFTLALQVEHEDTFQAHLGEALGAEVLNAGVDGFGPERERRMVKRLAEPTQADAALMVVFLGNDLVDAQRFNPQGYPVHADELPPMLSERDVALGWSALYFHYVSYERARSAAQDEHLAKRMQQELAIFLEGEDVSRHVGPTQNALTAFRDDCRAADRPCFVAVAPPSFAMDPARLQASLDLFGLQGTPDADNPARAVLAAMPEGLPALDLTPALRAADADEPVYLQFDGHWSAAGHRAVADALAEFLGEHGYPPQ